MQQTVFPISLHLVNLFYLCLHECLNALNMEAIVQNIFRLAAVASPGETIRLMATVSTLMGQQLYNLPSTTGFSSWRIINITSKFGTIVLKVNWFQFRFLLLTTVDHHRVTVFVIFFALSLKNLSRFHKLLLNFLLPSVVVLPSWGVRTPPADS